MSKICLIELLSALSFFKKACDLSYFALKINRAQVLRWSPLKRFNLSGVI